MIRRRVLGLFRGGSDGNEQLTAIVATPLQDAVSTQAGFDAR